MPNIQRISVRQFGAKGDGSTNDAAAIQSAFNFAATFSSACVEFDANSSYKVDSGLSLDTNRVKVTGNGATLLFTSLSAGAALTITQSEANETIRVALNRAHPVEGLYFYGKHAGTATCVHIESSGAGIPGVTFRGCSFIGFYLDVYLGEGCFLTTFDSCAFSLVAAFPGSSVVYHPSTINSGERNQFTDCFFANKPVVAVLSNGNSDTYFVSCSFDYCPRCLTLTGGIAYLLGCHIEGSSDSNWFHVSGNTNNQLSILGGDITVAVNPTSNSPFYVDSTVVNGGITVVGCRVYNAAGDFIVPLVGGTGTCRLSAMTFLDSVPHPVFVGANRLAYGGFEEANYAGDWTLSGGTPPSRSSAEARTGTYSLEFPASSGVTPQASRSIPCSPGQHLIGEVYYKVLGISGTSGTFYCTVDYQDKAGNSLSSSLIFAKTADVNTWTRASLSMNSPAPKGTDTARVLVNLFGATSGTPKGYVDDVIINVV